MRILQVSPFYPPHIGGIEYHVAALSRGLVGAGHHVAVYTSNLPRGNKVESMDGVEVHRFHSLISPINNPLMPGFLPKLLGSAEEFDVIHCHGHYHLSTTLTLFANMVKKRPIVLTCHGTILDFRGWRKATEMVFNKTVGRWTLRSVNRIVALTPSQADSLVRLGADRRRIAVIPMWVDLPEIRSDADAEAFRKRYRLGDRRIVLFVGRLLPVKGLDILIEAGKHCASRPAFVIVGDEAPGYKGTVRLLQSQVSKLGMEQDIFFLGWFPRENLGAAYAAADLFVLPSRGEGLPVALLEAMSFGMCVLATDVPGNRDVVKDGWNGVLVGPENPVELAQKIDDLLTDDALRQRLAKQARRDIEQNYNSDIILGKILELYREIQDRPGRRKN